MKKMTKEMKEAYKKARAAAEVAELLAATAPKEVNLRCPDKPAYIIPVGMTGAKLSRIKKSGSMNKLFSQQKSN